MLIYNMKNLLLLTTFLVLFSCIHTRIVTKKSKNGNIESCNLREKKIPVQFLVTFDKTPNFEIMHRQMFDNSDMEKKAKKAILDYINEQIDNNKNIQKDNSAKNIIEIKLTLLDDSKDRYDSTESNISACLSFSTLLLFPSFFVIEDNFIIIAKTKTNSSHKFSYDFGRIQYLSWLMIPYNIFITPFSDDGGVTITNIDFNKAFSDFTPRLKQNLNQILCEFDKTNKNIEKIIL